MMGKVRRGVREKCVVVEGRREDRWGHEDRTSLLEHHPIPNNLINPA